MISVVVPALNEEKKLYSAVCNIIQASQDGQKIPIEVIIINDGSTDQTDQVIRKLEKEFPFVRSIHHKENLGIGKSFLEAVDLAKYEKITIFPGDDYSHPYLIRQLLSHANVADFVISYTMNTEYRRLRRHVLSSIFCFLYMITFNCHLKYMNGSPVYRVSQLKKLKLRARRYSIFAEINIKLLRMGVSFYEVDGYMNSDSHKSSALRLGNVVEAVSTFIKLILDVYFFKKELFSKKPNRILPEQLASLKDQLEGESSNPSNAASLRLHGSKSR